jgi:hypothetical protein
VDSRLLLGDPEGGGTEKKEGRRERVFERSRFVLVLPWKHCSLPFRTPQKAILMFRRLTVTWRRQFAPHARDFSKYFGAVDQGTSSTRFIIFDEKLAPVASHQQPLNQTFPNPGWADMDPEEIFNSVNTCVRIVCFARQCRAVTLPTIVGRQSAGASRSGGKSTDKHRRDEPTRNDGCLGQDHRRSARARNGILLVSPEPAAGTVELTRLSSGLVRRPHGRVMS